MLIPQKVLREEARVDNRVNPEEQMSAAAVLKARCSVIIGIVRSLALYLNQNNIDSDSVEKKITTVINAFAATKDVSAGDLSWIRSTYVPSLASMRCAIDSECPHVASSSQAYLYWYTIVGNILDDITVFEYMYDSGSSGPKLNDNEKSIISSYHEAQRAYHEARSKFEDYFRKVTLTSLREVLLRHGTMLQQVAPDWYKYVSKSAGCNACDASEE